MKKIFLLLMVAAVAFSCGQAKSNSEQDGNKEKSVEKFTSKDGQFSAYFPTDPKRSSDMVPTEAGNIEMISFTYEKSATEAWMVAYGDYPSSLVEGTEASTLVKSARDGAFGDNPSIEKEKSITNNGFDGIYTKGKSGDGYNVIYEAFLAKNRLYQVMIIRDGSYPTDDDEKAFFDSFEITMKK